MTADEPIFTIFFSKTKVDLADNITLHSLFRYSK